MSAPGGLYPSWLQGPLVERPVGGVVLPDHGLVEPPGIGVGLGVDDAYPTEGPPPLVDGRIHILLQTLQVLGLDQSVAHGFALPGKCKPRAGRPQSPAISTRSTRRAWPARSGAGPGRGNTG